MWRGLVRSVEAQAWQAASRGCKGPDYEVYVLLLPYISGHNSDAMPSLHFAFPHAASGSGRALDSAGDSFTAAAH
jgi:hypothetical protein